MEIFDVLIHLYELMQTVTFLCLQSFSLDELYMAHEGDNVTTAVDESSVIDFSVPVEEDRRLPMFGYTVETLNMLVLPMVKTK